MSSFLHPSSLPSASAGVHWFQYGSGLEDLDVPPKMARLKEWCIDINKAQNKVKYDFVFVEEAAFIEFQPDSFGELVKNFRTYKE